KAGGEPGDGRTVTAVQLLLGSPSPRAARQDPGDQGGVLDAAFEQREVRPDGKFGKLGELKFRAVRRRGHVPLAARVPMPSDALPQSEIHDLRAGPSLTRGLRP